MNTRFDLSAETVTLDYGALLEVARIAYYSKLHEIESCVSYLQAIPRHTSSDMSHTSKRLANAANGLELAARAVHFLEEGKGRDIVKIVNHCR